MAPSLGLPHFNATNVWFAPGTAINSSEAFSHASKLQRTAYIANLYLMGAIAVVVAATALWSLPSTVLRLLWAPRWWYGASLAAPHPRHRPAAKRIQLPSYLRGPISPLPLRFVPGLFLSWTEASMVVVLWVVALGISAWCQSAFLTHASRATLILMGLTTFTVTLGVRSGGIGTLIAHGYTTVNFLHRWTGRLVLLLSTLHVVAYLVIFYKADIAHSEMRKPENYLAAMAYGGLCLTGLGSIRPIRTRCWLAFKTCHHVGILIFLAGLNYHAPAILPYLLAIWALIVLTALVRLVTSRVVKCELIPLGTSSTLLRTSSPYRGFLPAQHVRVRCLTLAFGVLESHPFTVASCDGDQLDLVIKAAGDWTRRLHAQAATKGAVRCVLDGPYGGPINVCFPAFETVVVVAGGSGISFALSIANGILTGLHHGTSTCARLRLVWVYRDTNDCTSLAPLLLSLLDKVQSFQQTSPTFEFRLILFETTSAQPAAPKIDLDRPLHLDADARADEEKAAAKEVDTSPKDSPLVTTNHGRPDFSQILAQALAVTQGGGMGVGACGPAGMLERIDRASRHLSRAEMQRAGGFTLHNERFSL